MKAELLEGKDKTQHDDRFSDVKELVPSEVKSPGCGVASMNCELSVAAVNYQHFRKPSYHVLYSGLACVGGVNVRRSLIGVD